MRQYHQSFYRPDNLCLVISGKVKKEEVFATLEPFEQKILKKGSLPPMTRPWVTSPVPPLTKSVDEIIKFPSDDEETGIVLLAWRGAKWAVTKQRSSLFLIHL